MPQEKVDGAKRRSNSIQFFIRASEYERKGEIGKAMEWYGKAFKLEPDVEKFIDFSKLTLQQQEGNSKKEVGEQHAGEMFDVDAPDMVEEIKRELTGSPQPLGLPDDVLLRIFRAIGAAHAPGVETLAQTCRKLYVLGRDPDLWRRLAINAAAGGPLDLGPYGGDFRRLFLLSPRVRTDGLYISRITYFRPGWADNSISNPVHLVTYYRYLRFFGAAEGYGVWWLVSTEEPKRAIEKLRQPLGCSSTDLLASPPTANIFYGRWKRLSEETFSAHLKDPVRSSGMKWRISLQSLPSKAHPVRHGTLKCLQYESVNNPEEPVPISTADWSKFIFSKVRSYLT